MEPTLNPDLLCQAYAMGFFPMPDPKTGKVVFLRPDPRAIIPLDGFHCSHSLYRELKKKRFHLSFDQAFEDVMRGCANRLDTWITKEFFEGYIALFDQEMSHSVEVWQNSKLVGGIYGVTLGGAFFAESMFHVANNASKVALYYLVEYLKASGFALFEVQFLTSHLETLGAIEIPDKKYQSLLVKALGLKTTFKKRTPWLPDPESSKNKPA